MHKMLLASGLLLVIYKCCRCWDIWEVLFWNTVDHLRTMFYTSTALRTVVTLNQVTKLVAKETYADNHERIHFADRTRSISDSLSLLLLFFHEIRLFGS